MLSVTLIRRLEQPRSAAARLVLPFELRQRSRLRAQLDNGEEVGVLLPRGGDCLLASDGRTVEVVAAVEEVSVLTSDDPRSLARAAYHLGNRHVHVQVGDGWLSYLRDHVLDDMLQGMGFATTHELRPFEPEGGAYSHHAHS
jgi:urease accessory protein